MTDRESLLAAIRANPRDDLPRLVYADWLDEFGTTDLDAATSEFIRVSVAFKGKQKYPVGLNGAMAPAAYEWLHDNWHRLVPTVTAPTAAREFSRVGRVVRSRLWALENANRHGQLNVWFEFGNGWLRRAWWWPGAGGYSGLWLYRMIVHDQPAAKMDSIGTPAWEEWEKRRAELNARRERTPQDRASELVAGLAALRTVLASRGVEGL